MAVHWYFDVISPFACLQWWLLRRDHPELAAKLQPVPVLLGALLDHFGSVGPAEIPDKRRFTYRFLLWRARSLGLPMRFPPTHPFNPLPALRLVIAAGNTPAAVDALFHHIWAEGRAADTPAALAGLAHSLGINDIDAAISAPDVKAALQANTAGAIAAGVFGVPTLVIDGEAFWGLDATDMARDYLADPSAFADAAMHGVGEIPVGVTRRRPSAD